MLTQTALICRLGWCQILGDTLLGEETANGTLGKLWLRFRGLKQGASAWKSDGGLLVARLPCELFFLDVIPCRGSVRKVLVYTPIGNNEERLSVPHPHCCELRTMCLPVKNAYRGPNKPDEAELPRCLKHCI